MYIYIYISVAIWAQGAFQCSVAIDIEVELCTMDVQRKLRAPKVIQVGSDFSGMDSFTTALARILPRGKFNVAFQSDILKHARQMMMNKVDPLLKPDILYKNVWQRDENNVPDVHLYMWTPHVNHSALLVVVVGFKMNVGNCLRLVSNMCARRNLVLRSWKM